MVPNFSALVQELLQNTLKSLIPETTALIIHSIECTPADENSRFQQLADLFEKANLDFQRTCLESLAKLEDERFIERLATSFLAANPQIQSQEQPKKPESLPTLEKVEELQKIAFLNQAAGQKEEALQAIQKAFAELNANQAMLMRELALELEKTDPEEARKTWEESAALSSKWTYL